MNATKFVMFLLFVVVANVGAIRQVKRESKETKYEISIPTTSNGDGTELSITVTRAFTSSLVNANATGGSGGADRIANESNFASASGSVIAIGTNAMAYSSSSANSQSGLGAAVVPNGFSTNGVGSGSANSYAFGRTGKA